MKWKIKSELEEAERNAKMFDFYMEYLDKNQETAILCSKSLENAKKIVENKRGIISEDEIITLLRNIDMQLYDAKKSRQDKIELLKHKSIKRDIIIDEYLNLRNLTCETIPYNSIIKCLKCFDLIDKIENQLLSFGITIGELLISIGKDLIELRYNELIRIDEVINNLISNNKNIDVESIAKIYCNEKGESKK